MRVLILLAVIGAATAAAPAPAAYGGAQRLAGQRIVGGSPTTVEEYPYMSNMQYGYWGLWWFQACGGSLLTSTSVLSAAHCYAGDSPSDWRVRLGTSFASTGGSLHEVSRLIVHERYSHNTLDNDVAVVWLATRAVLGNGIGVVPIAGTNFLVPDNSVVTTIGWGTLSSGGQSPEQLQHVDIYAINQETCAERYAELKAQPGFGAWPDITDGMLCAGVLDVGGKDACQGDSGGPLVSRVSPQEHVLVGIVSWGYGCAHHIYPGVNARVSQYTDWIVSNAST